MTKPLKMAAWFLPLIAVLIAVFLWPKRHEDRPECPHDWPERFSTSSISGRVTNVPEYHDCQRFLIRDASGGLKYDSLEGIFVRYELDTVYRSYFQIPDSANAHSFRVDREINPNGLQVVGQVLAFGDYPPLGIKKGSDCLVLQWATTSSQTTYRAWMVGVGADVGKCKKRADFLLLDPNRVELSVALIPTVGVVPPVSRWDWDSTNSLQYIGIACPTGWCEIHQSGPFQSSPTYSESHDPITKGLYDEQYLATYADGELKQDGTTFGTIYPDPRLDKQTMATYRSWQPVAWVALRTTSDAYQKKLNFEAASPLNLPLSELTNSESSRHLNKVELCFAPIGTAGCGAGAVHLPPKCGLDAKNNGTWYARETPPFGSSRAPTITCAEFRYYPPPQAPAVVRWRWQKKDETMWISCPSGCCQVKVKS